MFQVYRATEDVGLRACCDTLQMCPYDTGDKVTKEDFRQWFQVVIRCPAGSRKVTNIYDELN